jgi:hypothetical protein
LASGWDLKSQKALFWNPSPIQNEHHPCVLEKHGCECQQELFPGWTKVQTKGDTEVARIVTSSKHAQ